MAKIILVEDDIDIVKMYKLKFETTNHEFLAATDGESGWELIRREKPDLVLLDILTPKRSGFDIAREIKESSELSQTKVVMLTNLGSEEIQLQLRELGIEDYLVKSDTTPKEVLEYVNRRLKS